MQIKKNWRQVIDIEKVEAYIILAYGSELASFVVFFL